MQWHARCCRFIETAVAQFTLWCERVSLRLRGDVLDVTRASILRYALFDDTRNTAAHST
jgi:hypothetical protein